MASRPEAGPRAALGMAASSAVARAPLFARTFCVAAALALTVAGSLACSPAESAAPIPSAQAEVRDIERIVVATGTIEPEREVEVRPRIAGIIDQILVKAGQQVEKDEILVEIERELLEAQVNEARAGVQAANVELRFAKIAVGRANNLQRQGASSDSQHDEARAAYETALARLARAQAVLETLSVQLRHATVRAPSAGRVLDVPVEEGGAVSPVTSVTGGTVLLSLAATERLHLEGSVDENEISRIAVGQPSRIRTEAYGDKTFAGIVRDIAPVGNRIQNVTYFDVEIEIRDPDAHLLRPRMSGDAEIVAEQIDQALVVPEAALRYAGEHIYVNVLVAEGGDASGDAGGQAERRDIEIGVVDGQSVQVLSGLTAGERVSLQ